MSYKYDLRLTLRDTFRSEMILKQYYVKDEEFANPVATGDCLEMSNRTVAFRSDPVVVHQTPGPNPKSVIHADIRTFNEHLSRIEVLLAPRNPEEF